MAVTIDGTNGINDIVLGSSTPAAATVTTFTSNGIDDNADAVAITIDSSENVGIGTASPATYANGLPPVLAVGTSDNFATIQGRTDGPTAATNGASFGVSYTTNPINGARIWMGSQGSAGQQGLLAFETKALEDNTSQPLERMRIEAGGNVGIGSVNVLDKLHVYEEVNSALATQLLLQNQGAGNHAAGIAFQVTAEAEVALTVYAPKAAIIQERTNSFGRGPIKFMQDNVADANAFGAGDEVMRITNEGKVGIGTASPIELLDVVAGNIAMGNDRTSSQIKFGTFGHSIGRNTSDGSLYIGGGQANIALLNNVGIGTTAPGAKLQVNGTLGVFSNTQTVPTPDNGALPVLVMSGNFSNGGGEQSFWNTAAGLTGGFRFSQVTGSGTSNDILYLEKNLTRFYSGNTESMRIDASGRVTTPLQPSFIAKGLAAQTNYTANQVVVLTTTALNTGSHYNTSNGRFTAPVAGVYLFTFQLFLNPGNTSAPLALYKNNVMEIFTLQGIAILGIGLTSMISLAANDYVEIRVRAGGSNNATIFNGGDHTQFTGRLLG